MIRVTLAAPGPIPDDLVALIPTPARILAGETTYGCRLTASTETTDADALRRRLRERAGDCVAVAVIEGPLATQAARLLLMDVDSTLTTTEAIDLLAEQVGAGDRVAEITERAMRGELDFAASLRERVGVLAGMPTAALAEVAAATTLSPGAETLIAAARAAGAKVGVTSGGFTQLVAALAERLGLDFYNANRLEVATVDGVEQLTGRINGDIVDAPRKACDLRRFAASHGIETNMCVAVGDGANDLGMFAQAGLSVAYCAKPITASAADVAIGFARLDAVAAFAFDIA